MGTYNVTSIPSTVPWANPKRNPAPFSVAEFQAFLASKGMDRVAMLVGRYPDVVEPFLGQIHARLIEKGLLSRGPVMISAGPRPGKRYRPGAAGEGVEYAAPTGRAPSGELTDYEGWTQLAGLVDEALGDQPVVLREALKQAFMAEAAKAA